MVLFVIAYFSVSLGGKPAQDDQSFARLHHYLHIARAWHAESTALGIVLFALAVFVSSAAGLPPPGLLAIGGAALVGFVPAVLVSLPANALGAMVAFSVSRFVFGPLVRKRFPEQLKAVSEGVKRDGAWYLFSLRLVPLVPFPIVNLVLGVTPMSAVLFGVVTLVGRIPLTLLYCNAGTHLSTVHSTRDFMTPKVILSLAALALLPHIFRLAFSYMFSARGALAREKP